MAKQALHLQVQLRLAVSKRPYSARTPPVVRHGAAQSHMVGAALLPGYRVRAMGVRDDERRPRLHTQSAEEQTVQSRALGQSCSRDRLEEPPRGPACSSTALG